MILAANSSGALGVGTSPMLPSMAPSVLRDLAITSWFNLAEKLSSHLTQAVTCKGTLQGRTNTWGIKTVGHFPSRKDHHAGVAARPVNYRKAIVEMASRANNCVSGFLVSILLLVLATSSHYMVGWLISDWTNGQLGFHIIITARS